MHKSGRNLEAIVHGIFYAVVIIIPKLGRHEDVFSLEHAHVYALWRTKYTSLLYKSCQAATESKAIMLCQAARKSS